ncbi:MAG: heme-binding domain-containing protein [Bacteroidota bacterium]
MYKKIGLLLVIIVVVIQFIQPNKNISEAGIGPNDISKTYNMPQNVHDILVNKCYDCHSNNTRYPWYFSVQPIGWWLAAHVHEGKEHVNFSEFKNYDRERAAHKIEELQEVIEEGSMPLKAYVMLHEETQITPEDARILNEWIKTLPRN